MGFMSTAQAELAGPLNRRAGHEGEAARMGSPAAPSHPSFAVMAKIGHDSTSHEDFQMGLEILLRGVHRPLPPPALGVPALPEDLRFCSRSRRLRGGGLTSHRRAGLPADL
jgi:hypothetical protein